MATKTISLRIEAYERLRAARGHPRESFSDVVMRARWDKEIATGRTLLEHVRERGPLYTSEELSRVESAKAEEASPEDKWVSR